MTVSPVHERLDPGVVLDGHHRRTVIQKGEDVLVPIEQVGELDSQELVSSGVDCFCVMGN